MVARGLRRKCSSSRTSRRECCSTGASRGRRVGLIKMSWSRHCRMTILRVPRIIQIFFIRIQILWFIRVYRIIRPVIFQCVNPLMRKVRRLQTIRTIRCSRKLCRNANRFDRLQLYDIVQLFSRRLKSQQNRRSLAARVTRLARKYLDSVSWARLIPYVAFFEVFPLVESCLRDVLLPGFWKRRSKEENEMC